MSPPLNRFAPSPQGDGAGGRAKPGHGVRWRGLLRGLSRHSVLASPGVRGAVER